jgi:hypothetical protein
LARVKSELGHKPFGSTWNLAPEKFAFVKFAPTNELERTLELEKSAIVRSCREKFASKTFLLAKLFGELDGRCEEQLGCCP